jgi:hypothetical protein
VTKLEEHLRQASADRFADHRPRVGAFKRPGRQAGEHPVRRRGQQHSLERLAGREMVARVVAGGGENGGRDAGRLSASESPQPGGTHASARDIVMVARLGDLHHAVEGGPQRGISHEQRCSLSACRVHAGGEHGDRHRVRVEVLALRVPVEDAGEQPLLLVRGGASGTQLDPGEQVGLVVQRDARHHRLIAQLPDREPQVKQRCPAGQTSLPRRRRALARQAGSVEQQLQAAPPQAEPPGLTVGRRRRAIGDPGQLGQRLPEHVPSRADTPCSHRVPPLALGPSQQVDASIQLRRFNCVDSTLPADAAVRGKRHIDVGTLVLCLACPYHPMTPYHAMTQRSQRPPRLP